MLPKILLLAVAGALGTLARFGLAGLAQRLGAGFPWGTLAVNVVGCFLAGLLWTLFETRVALAPEARTVVMVGFLGAFTTFSTLVLETGQMFGAAAWTHAAANVTLHLVLGLAALFAGLALGR